MLKGSRSVHNRNTNNISSYLLVLNTIILECAHYYVHVKLVNDLSNFIRLSIEKVSFCSFYKLQLCFNITLLEFLVTFIL